MIKYLVIYIIGVMFILPLFWRFEGLSLLPIFKYLDEFITLIASFWIVQNWRMLSHNEKQIFRLILLLLFVGSLGTLINKLQTEVFPVILDAFLCIKCFIVFIFANHVVFTMSDKLKVSIIKNVNNLLIPFLCVAFAFSIINLVVNVGMSDRIRHGLRCFSFLYVKSGTFSDMFRYFFIFLVLGYKLFNKKKLYLFIILLSTITWILTLRTRSIAYAPIFLFLFFWIIVKNRPFKINVAFLIFLAIIVFTFASDKLEDSYGDEEAGPRAILLYYGIKTMQTYMPIGAGFGTYGTDVACTYYSPLYYKYGFNTCYGLSPNDTRYAHDNYWPAIMGEFGIIGVIIVALILFYIGKEIFRKYKGNRTGLMLNAYLFLTALLTSSAAPVFFAATYLFMLMPLSHIKCLTKKQTIKGTCISSRKCEKGKS